MPGQTDASLVFQLVASHYRVVDSAHQYFAWTMFHHLPTTLGGAMNARNTVFWISLVVVAMLAGLAVTWAQTGTKADAVAAITKLENDGVKADLANDKSFNEKVLADDWTGGDSGGTWFTKAEVLKLMADPEHNKTNSEKLSELKVRVYGNTAIATYKDTYDAMLKGEHRTRTVIGTDTFVKIGNEWKQVASHASTAK
jgi:hypothetical protein